MSISRRVGAEFEYINVLSPKAMSRAMCSAGLQSEFRDEYTNVGPSGNFDCCVELDPAFRTGAYPQEIKTRVLEGHEWRGLVGTILKVLKDAGSVIDSRAAYHLRVDVPEATDRREVLRSLWNTVWQFENVIFGLVHPLAREMMSRPLRAVNHMEWCKSKVDFDMYLSGCRKGAGMNLRGALWETPVVEFRWHQSTLDPAEATLWAELMCGIVDYAVTHDHPAVDREKNTPEALEDFLELVAGGCNQDALRRKHRCDPDDAPWYRVLKRHSDDSILPDTRGFGLKLVGRKRQFV